MNGATLDVRALKVSWPNLALGLAALGWLWLGPLASQSRTAFSAHMLLHLGLMLAAAPLLARAVVLRMPSPEGLAESLSWYLLAGAFEMVVVWGWHTALLHDAAGHNAWLFAVEQASFLAAGTGLWLAIFSARTPASALAGGLVAALTFSHMSMFGLLLALVPRPIYDPVICQGWVGLSRLDDQHLGGALMAAGGLAYLAAAAWLVRAALSGNRAGQ